MKTVIAFVLMGLLADASWLTNFDSAKSTATKEGKLILLNFSGSDWCGPCVKMKREVFESDAFQSVAEKQLVLVRADFPRAKKNQLPADQLAHNEKLAEKYNASGKFPLTVLLDADGKIIKEWDGYVFASQDKFIADLKATIGSR